MPDLGHSWFCTPYSVAAARALSAELGLQHVTSSILVRRGYDTPGKARDFLEGAERHDPLEMPGIQAAAALILDHVSRGTRIVIHGDYDVDGVCSSAVLVRALQRLGAHPVCKLPSRFEDGYGLSLAGVERLAREDTGLLVTVDCGITAVDEVARARQLGMDVVVTDHHRPGDSLPDCPVVHPALGYPFPELCAAGVAYKLAEALALGAGADPTAAREDLDLVALATVCDVVPLVGENRRLVREGLEQLRRTAKPGLRALMRVASCDPGTIDAGSLGFRLGPRINAAGRLSRPDAALELLLTQDQDRAGEVAGELDILNGERQDTEMRIAFAAEAELAAQAHQPAFVLAGQGWHSGVIGIVASRLVERHCRPCVLIALDGDSGRGSGRSISAFDLHAGLAACSQHLGRFGGHRMAAGLDIAADAVDAFRADFVQHAASALSPHDLRRVERVDALAGPDSLGLPLAEEIERLGPFGHKNPRPTLLVPAARIQDARSMGDEGQHARFSLAGGGARARAVAFRTTARSLQAAEGPQDVAVRLELNEWNGTVEPRLVLRGLSGSLPGPLADLDGPDGLWDCIRAELERELGPWCRPRPALRALTDSRGRGLAGALGDLLSSGESVLIVCADTAVRRRALEPVLGAIAAGGSVALASWELVALRPQVAHGYQHAFALDPAPVPEEGIPLLASLPGGSHAHLGWGPAEQQFADAVGQARSDMRSALAATWRALRDGDAPFAPGSSSAWCARLARVLCELELARFCDGDQPQLVLGPCKKADLQASAAFRHYQAAAQQAAPIAA